MHVRTPVAAAAAIITLAGCNPDSTATGSSKPSATASAGSTATGGSKVVPELVGKGLQAAQDAAQAAGFYNLTSHDSLGRDRHQILDRDWKVCSQKPAAGTGVSTDTQIDLGAVKVTEACPKGDQAPPAKTGTTMPNFVGKGLAEARDSLPSDASITTKDATGDDRIIILESNWTVCTQTPKAGTPFSGQPVTFTAVKTDETCP